MLWSEFVADLPTFSPRAAPDDRLPPTSQLYPRTPSSVNPNQPPWPAYRGYHTYSFAHATMGVRLPTILGKAIDDVVETLNDEWEEDRVVDLTKCIERMEDLMEDLQENKVLRPIVDDGEGDVALWNKGTSTDRSLARHTPRRR